jgi:hypothetical protein
MSVPSTFTALSSANQNNAALPSAIRNMLKFFLLAPFRGLTRLLSLDRLLGREEEPSHIISSSGIYNTDGGSPMTHLARPPPSTFQHSLGPWSFFASGYAISLFAMVRRVRTNFFSPAPYPDIYIGSTPEPHPEHSCSKSTSTATSCSFQPSHTQPLGPSSPGSSLSFPSRFIIYLLQSGPSVANYVLHPQGTSPLDNLALASIRLLPSFFLEPIYAIGQLGGSQGNG